MIYIKKFINILLTSFIIICIGILCYSGYQIFSWHQSNKKIDEQVDNIDKITEVKEVEDSEKVEIVNPPKETKKTSYYWGFIKVKLIDVNLDELKKINDETIGWIQVGGTTVNYPIVQHSNNKFYLTHQFDKKYNDAGWIFMDYRNNSKDFDQNTIIYGHGRLNKTMFGSLKNVVKKSWYSNKDNYIVKISTESENTLWQVFSTYRIKTTNDYLQTNFSSDEEYLEFLNMLKDRSVFDYKVDLNSNDKIISLSTCHNESEKIVLHAKLIKRENKK